jgi:hypothetical protein
VVTTPIAPFVLPATDPLAGFSIDRWEAMARRMHVDFTVLPQNLWVAGVFIRGS